MYTGGDFSVGKSGASERIDSKDRYTKLELTECLSLTPDADVCSVRSFVRNTSVWIASLKLYYDIGNHSIFRSFDGFNSVSVNFYNSFTK